MKVTDEQARKMKHALGLTNSKESYRNYYCAAEPDVADWLDLVEKGYATERRKQSEVWPDRTFHVSDEGREALEQWEKENG